MSWIEERIKAEYRKYESLEWEKIAEKKIIASILDFCHHNNTLEFKDSKMKLAVLDGGHVNVIKLKNYLEEGEK